MTVGLAKGTVIGGDFRILEELAEGGMGSVYVAEQLSTGKRRALKVMKPQIVTDARSRRRFVEEAKIGGRIASEHVVEVIAAGVDEALGVPWLAMELLSGVDLEAHLRAHGRLSLAELIELYEQLAHALGEAHAQGVVHRDLKPENLFLARSRRVGSRPVLKILDFGIAAFVSSDKTAATVTTAIGSPLWVAPEQMETGAELRPSTDVFAMGLIAFYLLTGKSYWRAAHAVPFSLNPLIAEIVALPLSPASERAKELGAVALPGGFDAWFGRCVVREPEARFADANEAFEALARLGSVSPTVDAYAPTEALPSGLASARVPPTRGLKTPDSHPGVAPTLELGAPAASGEPGAREVPATLLLSSSDATVASESGSPGPREAAAERVAPRAGGSSGLRVKIGAALAAALAAVAVVVAINAGGGEEPEPDSVEAASTVEVELTSAFAGLLWVDGEPQGAISPGAPRRLRLEPGPHRAEVRATAPGLEGVTWGERELEVREGSRASVSFEDPCPEGMVYVPGSSFQMGSADGEGPLVEHPRHEVTLAAYCIGRTEVTVHGYRACVRAGRCRAAGTLGTCYGDHRPEHPANCVSWDDAVAYCRYRDARLPTEAEWEYAARGTDGRRFPWGSQAPSDRRLRWSGDCGEWGCVEGTAAVGSYPAGASPFGVLDMAGNVWEWVSDWYGDYPSGSQSNPVGPDQGRHRVLRGGSCYGLRPAWVRAANRDRNTPSSRLVILGFRCARGG